MSEETPIPRKRGRPRKYVPEDIKEEELAPIEPIKIKKPKLEKSPKTILYELVESREKIFEGIDQLVKATSSIYDELERLEAENETLKKKLTELEHIETTAVKIEKWKKKMMDLNKLMEAI